MLVSRCLGFVPAGLRVSGYRLSALSARFRPSVVPTCLAGRLWLYLVCVSSGSFLAVSGFVPFFWSAPVASAGRT